MNKKGLLFSILAVLLIGLIIAGSTFAYFQWTTAENQRTAVNVSIEQGRITMHIEPEETTVTGLTPTSNCGTGGAVLHTTVTVVNNTGTLAIPSFKLSARVTKGGSDTLTSDALSHIQYKVQSHVPGYRFDIGWCSSAQSDSVQVGDTKIYSDGTFQNVSTSGAWTDIPNGTDTYLPRLYDKNTGDVQGTTFKAEPYSTTTYEMSVFVWIDENYTATNVGDTVNDPLNDATIELTWSANSKIEQVTDSLIDSGLYSNGVFTSWDTLVSNGDITVSNNAITASNSNLSGELVIPNSVTSIGYAAFSESNLTNVIIGNSVTTIGEYAFAGSQITSVEIPNSVTSIGDSAFENNQLTSVVIGDSVTTIGDLAFLDSNLTNVIIGNSVTYIGLGAFSYSNLTNVIIPNSVTSIGIGAFDNTSLTDVYYEGTEAEWNAISIDSSNEELTGATIHYNSYEIPALYDVNGNFTPWDTLVANGDITVVDNKITNSNMSLTGELIIPNSVTSIGGSAFRLSLLTSVVIPNSVTSIGVSAFGSARLTSVIIPDSVTSIEYSAFSNSGLKSVEIPDSVTTIGENAFGGSRDLKDVIIGSSVTSIGDSAFGVTSLTDVYYRGSEEEWNAISIGSGNNPLINATMHYNYTG